MISRIAGVFLLIFSVSQSFCQTSVLQGTVWDEGNIPLELATVYFEENSTGTFSDENGKFQLKLPAGRELKILFRYAGKKDSTLVFILQPDEVKTVSITLFDDIIAIDEVLVKGKKEKYKDERNQAGTIKLDPKIPKYLPSAFNDFNKVLVTLPGVISNNELSSQYTVRGGNFDENLVYVNEMEIYRPFLVRAGQQEGLSFINPDLVEDVQFSAGGWQPRYGDKLSSVLAIKYKDPVKLKGSVSIGLLGGTFHIENATKNQRISYIVGARQKSSRYLLNTLPVQGEYFPKFNDVQSFVTFDLTKRTDSLDFSKRTTISLLTSYARNRYNVIPQTRETNFGNMFQAYKLTVAFAGQEMLNYDTWQGGVKFSHRTKNEKFKTNLIYSAYHSQEREYFDIDYAYRICDLEIDLNGMDFNKCVLTRGLGAGFDHARNKLTAVVHNLTNQNFITLNKSNKVEFGITQSFETINDRLYEYSYLDSSGYVDITDFTDTKIDLVSSRSQAYIQHTIEPNDRHLITYGVRLNYWTFNKQLLVSPRIQYAYKPHWDRDVVFRVATGIYQQSPFYREFRNREGEINYDIKAQTSYHVIAGTDYRFQAWGRDFKLITEAYYKHLTNVIPYDMDNVRLRYFATNSARAYAVGGDMRISGEFIRGAESWFSLGIMQTKEDVEGDGRGYISRPSDQRVTVGVFFQDHLPNNPSIKMYLNGIYGSGLPHGPPTLQGRNMIKMPFYNRVDIGFSKLISFVDRAVDKKSVVESIWISLEVLNLFGANNTISYMYLPDITNNQYMAVPTTLSTRFLNLRMLTRF